MLQLVSGVLTVREQASGMQADFVLVMGFLFCFFVCCQAVCVMCWSVAATAVRLDVWCVTQFVDTL